MYLGLNKIINMLKIEAPLDLDHNYKIDFYLSKNNSIWTIYCHHGKYAFYFGRIQDSLVNNLAIKDSYILESDCIVHLFSNNGSYDKKIRIYLEEESGVLNVELVKSNFHYGIDFTINEKVIEKANPNW